MPNCLTIIRPCSSNFNNLNRNSAFFNQLNSNFDAKKPSPLILEFKFFKNNRNNLHNIQNLNEFLEKDQQKSTQIKETMGTSRKASSPSNTNTYYKPAPAEICYRDMRFLITDRPSDVTIYQFIDELKKHCCQDVVRVCEPTYRTEPLNKEQITVLDWEFPDGNPPPKEIRDKWIQLVKKRFMEDPGSCIAVHCVAGLGRAPVLVALALMEAGMKYEDAVELIRQHRRGAINQKQLTYLEKYKANGELKKRENCCVM